MSEVAYCLGLVNKRAPTMRTIISAQKETLMIKTFKRFFISFLLFKYFDNDIDCRMPGRNNEVYAPNYYRKPPLIPSFHTAAKNQGMEPKLVPCLCGF
jgi:hypothetical protein